MLEALGASSVSELWPSVPPELELRAPLDLPPALTEMEARRALEALARANDSAASHVSFLGGGAYDHYVPSAVGQLILRSEFYTAYTPYQPEVAQGTLQAIYEFQTLICELTGLEVANASLYDGGSALAEAARTARAVTGRERLLVSEAAHPGHREVVATYHRGAATPIETVRIGADGRLDLDALRERLNDDVAAVLLQSPSYLGVVEDAPAVAEAAHAAGALLVVSADPFAMAILEAPGRQGADLVVGEGQGLGNALSLGGPYVGFLAARRRFIRQLPGRIIGLSVDARGNRAYRLALQTREQHIRREKATSNICTNQGLNALAATIYLCIVGREGFLAAARSSFQKAHYAARRIAALPGYELAFEAPFFHEFAVRTPVEAERICAEARAVGVLAGIPLGRAGLRNAFPSAAIDPARTLLVAVTEKRTREEIDRLAEILAEYGPAGRPPARSTGARRKPTGAAA